MLNTNLPSNQRPRHKQTGHGTATLGQTHVASSGECTLDKIQPQQQTEDVWQFVLQYILADSLEEAHASILIPFLEVSSALEEELLHNSLTQFLKESAARLEEDSVLQDAYKIVSFAQSIFPNDFNNLLHLIILSAQLDELSFEMLTESNFHILLEQTEPNEIDQARMYQAMFRVMQLVAPENISTMPWDFVFNIMALSIEQASEPVRFIQMFLSEARLISKYCRSIGFKIQTLEICLEYCPQEIRFDLLCQLATSAAECQQYDKSIAIISDLQNMGVWQHDKLHKMIASEQYLTCLMQAGHWHEIPDCAEQHTANIKDLVASNWDNPNHLCHIITTEYFLNYCHDQPRVMHGIRNDLAKIASSMAKKKANIATGIFNDANRKQANPGQKVLKIGYLASTLTNHSVGWLSRWIVAHHDHSNFETYIYNVCISDRDEFNIKYFRKHATRSHYINANPDAVVEQIQKDEIDILVDLDSACFNVTYEVLCYKPAPIQVTWLGWDASGCPEIDYFMADPYVLPADAQDYYHSKIWRLPHTYLAIDGFEVNVPTKRREDYGIPADAVVYFCGQQAYKYHPDSLRLHMQIIKEVPNSYLLIKLRGDKEYSMNRYQEMAKEIGISMGNLRFLEPDIDEPTHRANLGIADIALDTFPYNGATTTLEIIWAGIPLVTKVGESFFARNSYTFLTNANITEGIAKTDEEYLDWAVRFGKDIELRQQVSGKMFQSRKNSHLWNAKEFTKEMEKAYQQMWQIYQNQYTTIP